MTRTRRATAALTLLARTHRVAAAFTLLTLAGCVRPQPAPPADVQARVAATTSFSAEVGLKVDGPTLRGRAGVLLGFRRPDGLRIEIPGPSGPRLVAVTRGDVFTVEFPGERAYYEGRPEPEELGALLGVALRPSDVMDLLLGHRPPGVVRYDARWKDGRPARVQATLEDGTRLTASIKDPELGADLPEAAFAPASHEGWRTLTQDEAREMWSR